ncbi:MAG: L-threonylcarbamoyladenylate synthase [Chlorobiota bacterium]
MKTIVLNPERDPTALQQAADLLQRGHLVAFPTETVYGLGARVFCAEAVAKIFAVKGRPADNPLIVHIASPDEVQRVAVDIPEAYWVLARTFFPGPLTVVLRRHPEVPPVVSGGLETIAVRMPRHPYALELIRLTGEPIAAPSANRSGRPSPTTAEHVLQDLQGEIAAVVDGGPCEIGLESTVLHLLTDPPMILRPGVVTAEELSAVLGRPVEYWHVQGSGPTPSPGMRYRHYAPRAAVVLLSSWEVVRQWIEAHPEANPVVLAPQPGSEQLSVPLRALQVATLYAEFRRADDEGRSHVLVLCTPAVQANRALWDRLRKAAASQLEEAP